MTKPLKPFLLDLGAAVVRVEVGELHDKACAVSLLQERRIVIDMARTGGQELTQTLLHECLHHLDDLFMAQWLSNKHHKRLDIIATMFDLLLTRNWAIIKTLYDEKGKK